MASNTKEKSAKEMAQEFIQKHELEEFISHMLNTLVHNYPDDPKVFMIKYIAGQIDDNERLKENGILLTCTLPRKQVHLKRPEWNENCNLLAKDIFTASIWQENKRLFTKAQSANFREHFEPGISDQDGDHLGFFAMEGGSQETFERFMKELIQKHHETQVSEHKSESIIIDKLEEFNSKQVSNVNLKINRNLKGEPQVCFANKDQLSKIENKVSTCIETFNLGKTFEKKDVNQSHFNSNIHNALKLNENWPNGRSYFATDDTKCYVNQKDHIIIEAEGTNDLSVIFSQTQELLSHLEAQLGFDIHPKFGQLTIDPREIGTSLTIEVVLKLDFTPANYDSSDVEVVKDKSDDNTWIVRNKKFLNITEYETLKKVQDVVLEIIPKDVGGDMEDVTKEEENKDNDEDKEKGVIEEGKEEENQDKDNDNEMKDVSNENKDNENKEEQNVEEIEVEKKDEEKEDVDEKVEEKEEVKAEDVMEEKEGEVEKDEDAKKDEEGDNEDKKE